MFFDLAESIVDAAARRDASGGHARRAMRIVRMASHGDAVERVGMATLKMLVGDWLPRAAAASGCAIAPMHVSRHCLCADDLRRAASTTPPLREALRAAADMADAMGSIIKSRKGLTITNDRRASARYAFIRGLDAASEAGKIADFKGAGAFVTVALEALAEHH